jgi:hypothetical protein
MLPGATVTLEKLGAEIDGSYRVERAVHQFSKHGYYVNLKLVRTAKAKAPAPAKQTPPPPAPAPTPAPPEAAPPEPGGTGGTGAAAGTGGTGGAAGTGATAHGGTGSGGTGTAGTGTGAGTAGTGTGTGTAGTGTGTGTAGTAATVAPAAGTKINFRFEPATGFCGDRVHVKAETENLADGTAVTITLRPRQGSSPRLATVAATVTGNRIDQEFEIANVDFGAGASALAQVEIEATSTNAAQITCATALQVRGRSDGASQHFSVNRTWGDAAKHQRFGADPRFDQKVEKYRNLVNVTADILKAWGGTYITFKRIAGTPAAPPAAGGRGCYGGYYWARNSTGVGMQPDQYHDGTNWVALPAGFRPGAADYFSIAFYKDGSTYKVPGAATLRYPDAFADYEFDSETYTNIRAGWAQRVHDTWSDQWALRRSACKSDKSVNCCKYSVDVKLTLNKVEAWSDKVIMVGAGDFRNNMSTFFLDSNRPATVPHEIGHLMDNPDEYVDGAVDVTISGDGANNGIDDDSIMGLNKSKVKKRHYHAFADMLQKIMKTAYGNDEKHDVVDK